MCSGSNNMHQMVTRSKGHTEDMHMYNNNNEQPVKLVEDYNSDSMASNNSDSDSEHDSESETETNSETTDMDHDETDQDETDQDETDHAETDHDEDYDPNKEETDENQDCNPKNKLNGNNNIFILYNQPSSFEYEYEYEDEDVEEEYEDEYQEDEEDTNEPKTKEAKYKEYKSKLFKQDERKYFSNLPDEEKDRIIETEEMIVQSNKSDLPIRFKILNSQMSDMIKSIAISKLDVIAQMECANGEYTKIMNWITNLCNIPIGRYVSLPITNTSPRHDIFAFLEQTSEHFNNNIYGHDAAKEQIIRIIAQWIANPGSKGNVIGIHGNPGVGKTTLVKDCICKSLNLPFQFIPLGGASDGSYLDGHNFTYEGSTWGKIVDCLMKSGCMNPVLYFDELDKVSETFRGQELINILIHLTDPAQNSTFFDKYFGDVPFDLSKCLIIFTYNNDMMVNPILKDRMIRIQTNDYTLNDKLEIMKNFLIPEYYTLFSFQPEDIIFNKEMMQLIIERTEKEAGVRNLKRSLELIFSNINLIRMIKTEDYTGPIGKTFNIHPETKSILPITITKDIIDLYIKDVSVNESHHHLYM